MNSYAILSPATRPVVSPRYAAMVNAIREWARDLLRCPRCGSDLAFRDDGAECCDCEYSLLVVEGVAEMLVGAHEAVENERKAVAALDAGQVSLGDPVGSEAAQAAVQRHIETSRRQLR